jgi:hypothetical protein
LKELWLGSKTVENQGGGIKFQVRAFLKTKNLLTVFLKNFPGGSYAISTYRPQPVGVHYSTKFRQRVKFQSNCFFLFQQLFATQAALFRDAHGPQGTLLQGVVAQTALLGAHKVNDIDLSLPITSTYLKRMRALGLAAASLEHAYQQNNNPGKPVS